MTVIKVAKKGILVKIKLTDLITPNLRIFPKKKS